MIRRLAIVFWWLGAVLLVLGIIGVVNNSGDKIYAVVEFFFFPALGCFGASFVLGGSFLRPPRLGERNGQLKE